MCLKKEVKKILNKLPYIKTLKQEIDLYKTIIPPGHFYSPLVSKEDILSKQTDIFNRNLTKLSAISLNEEVQCQYLKQISTYYSDLPFSEKKKVGLRYYYENGAYSYSDAIFLYGLIRTPNPQKIIEVGSGHSSSLMLDVNDLYFNGLIKLVFIDPYPDILENLFKNEDSNKCQLIKEKVQDVELKELESLKENDILFIDSSHVAKCGSDVNHLFFNVCPNLKKGVYIHFHDIFYPFEYPKEWILEHERSWNESYLLRAFLSYNDTFEIVLFSTYLEQFYKEWFLENMPLYLKNPGGSIWLKKIK